MQQLGFGRKGDGLRLHGGIDRDLLEVLATQCAGLVRHPQALGQQQFQLVAEPLAPNQLVLHVDDLVQPRPEQVVPTPSSCASSAASSSPMQHRITLRSERESQTNLQRLAASTSQFLQSQTVSNPKNRLPLNRLEPCSRATNDNLFQSGSAIVLASLDPV